MDAIRPPSETHAPGAILILSSPVWRANPECCTMEVAAAVFFCFGEDAVRRVFFTSTCFQSIKRVCRGSCLPSISAKERNGVFILPHRAPGSLSNYGFLRHPGDGVAGSNMRRPTWRRGRCAQRPRISAAAESTSFRCQPGTVVAAGYTTTRLPLGDASRSIPGSAQVIE